MLLHTLTGQSNACREENQKALKKLKKEKELKLDGVYPNLNKLFADNRQGFVELVQI